jgi:uncharacterized protein YigE (DUF2233 family)
LKLTRKPASGALSRAGFLPGGAFFDTANALGARAVSGKRKSIAAGSAAVFAVFAAFVALAGFSAAARAVECRRVQSQGKSFTACTVDARQDQLRLFRTDAAGQPYKGFDALAKALSARGQTLLFAMNAGMYHPDFSPVGLFVDEGAEQAPLSTAQGRGNFFLQPNGVFYLADPGAGASAGRFGVMETGKYAAWRSTPGSAGHVTLATQSGPMLLIGGQVHRAFRPNSGSRLLRNGVGIVSPRVAVFAISDEPVNFFEFALLFRDTLGCKDALYFDGNISSLHDAASGRSDALHPLGPIIGVAR